MTEPETFQAELTEFLDRELPRQLAELPWFARNVAVKALILVRLRRGPWPY